MLKLAANLLPPLKTMLRAWTSKDPRFDGVFFVAVKTTGVFCRPVCRAKPAKAGNVEFFPSAEQALYHGYRACKLCRPLDSGHAPPPVVNRLMNLIEQSPARRWAERDLRAMSIDPSTARRQFRSYCRMTFAAYQRARRMGIALRDVRNGTPVIRAQQEAGFESGSGFREAITKLLGTTPRDSAAVCVLTSCWIPTPLGTMLAVAYDDGVAMLDFIDRKGLERGIHKLRRRFGGRAGAVVVPGRHRYLEQVAWELGEYFDRKRTAFDVPLVPRGSEFEEKTWRSLRKIPCGQTRSYRDVAAAIGAPTAIRAVARANGANFIGILIPCHRVIGSDGELKGYGGGIARKRWLLDHEQRVAGRAG